MTSIDYVLAKLEGVKPRGRTGGRWTARCPCHDDGRNSLGVDVTPDGAVLVCCWAGCRQEDLCRALGLTKATRVKAPPVVTRKSQVFEASYYAAKSLRGQLVSGWSYRYADGSHAFAVYRLELDGKKEIRPVCPCDGGYTFGLPPVPRPIYRLPEVFATEGPVVVCEGEKAADAVADAGWCATTSAGGANSAHLSDWSPLALRRVIIWPDNDKPGFVYANSVRAIIAEYGAVVTILDPVGERGDDAADVDDIDAVLIGGTDGNGDAEEHGHGACG